jgi:predicted esterase
MSDLLIWELGEGAADRAVIAVHGRTLSPEDMRARSAGFTDVGGVRFFGPRAPGNTWYPKPFLEPIADNEPSLTESLAAIDAALDAVLDAGFASDRIVLWGFSQGACLVSHWLLTRPHPVGGAIIHTGGFIGPDALASAAAPLPIPVVMRSIEHDPFVPASRVLETAELFRSAGATVDLRIDPGDEHIVTPEAMAASSALLRAL